MIGAASVLLALQPTAAEPPIVTYNRALTFAELSLHVARQQVCGLPSRARRTAVLAARLRESVERARPVFGDVGEPLSIVEPAPEGPDCARFGRSARAAARHLDQADTILAAASGGH